MRRSRILHLFEKSDSPLDEIERWYIFRVSRAVPTALIALASIGLVIAVLSIIVSVIPPRPVQEPAPAQIPPEVSVSLQDVKGMIATPAQAAATADTTVASTPSYYTAPPSAPAVNPAWVGLARRVHQVRRLLEPTWSWDDRYETYCSSAFFGTCYQTSQRQTAWGVSRTVFRAVNLFNDGNEEHLVYLPDANVSYEVNVTGLDRKAAALDELIGILRQIPARQRLEALDGWTTLRQQREEARATQIAQENARVTMQREAEIARVAAAHASHSLMRRTAVIGIAGGIALVWMLGLTLALLAIERNTRKPAQAAALPSPAPLPSQPLLPAAV